MEFHIIDARIRFSCVYTCDTCGAQEVGTETSIEVRTQNEDDLKYELIEAGLKPKDMPIGWNNTFDYGINCGCMKGTT